MKVKNWNEALVLVKNWQVHVQKGHFSHFLHVFSPEFYSSFEVTIIRQSIYDIILTKHTTRHCYVIQSAAHPFWNLHALHFISVWKLNLLFSIDLFFVMSWFHKHFESKVSQHSCLETINLSRFKFYYFLFLCIKSFQIRISIGI